MQHCGHRINLIFSVSHRNIFGFIKCRIACKFWRPNKQLTLWSYLVDWYLQVSGRAEKRSVDTSGGGSVAVRPQRLVVVGAAVDLGVAVGGAVGGAAAAAMLRSGAQPPPADTAADSTTRARSGYRLGYGVYVGAGRGARARKLQALVAQVQVLPIAMAAQGWQHPD